MNWLRRLALLLFAFVLLVFGVLEWPQVLLNPTVIGFGADHFAKRLTGADIEWSELRTEVQSVSFFEKRIQFRFEDLCAEYAEAKARAQKEAQEEAKSSAMRGCFRAADLSLAYQFRSVLPKLTEVGPVALRAGQGWANADRLREIQKDSRPKPSPPLRLPGWLSEAKLGSLDVQVTRWDVESKAGTAQGLFRLRSEGKLVQLDLQAKGKKPSGAPLAAGQAKLRARSLSQEAQGVMRLGGPWQLAGDADVDLREKGKARLEFQAEPAQSPAYRYQAHGKYTSSALVSRLEISGVAEPTRIHGVLSQQVRLAKTSVPAQAGGPPVRLTRGEVRDCRYDYRQTDASRSDGRIQLHCPVYVDLPEATSDRMRALTKALELEKRAALHVTADLAAAYPPDTQRPIQGAVEVKPGSFMNPAIRTEGGMHIDLAVIPAELPKIRKLDGRLALTAGIPRFEKFVGRLSGTPLAVPAPFQALEGPVEVAMQGGFDQGGGALDTRLSSRLLSAKRTQRLGTEGRGTFRVDTTQPKLALGMDLDVVLTDIRLTLPKMTVGPAPQLFPDPRLAGPAVKKLLETAQEEAKKIGLRYDVSVHTPPGHPVELASGLTETPVPVNVDLRFRDPRRVAGEITIDQFPVRLFGGRNVISQVHIALDARHEEGLLVGEINVQTQGRTLTPVPPTQLAGQAAGQEAATRVGPKFAIPVTRILTSILVGIPLEEVSVEPNVASLAPEVPRPEERSQSAFLQFRRRY